MLIPLLLHLLLLHLDLQGLAYAKVRSHDAGLIVLPKEPKFNFDRILRNGIETLLIPKRGVRVWLPPDYVAGETQAHPVLYCHDGQNVVANDEEVFPPPRSWRLGVTLSKLIDEGLIVGPSPIVVLINNCCGDGPGGENRLGDIDILGQPFFRRRWLEYGDGYLGETYIDWVCDHLKPAIDAEFRTKSEPQFTYAMGSSMGGRCAFHSVWRRSDVFGHAACLSPCFQPPLLAQVLLQGSDRLSSSNPNSRRIYIDNGGDTDDIKVSAMPISVADGLHSGWWWLDTSLQPGVEAMCAALRIHNFPFSYYREPGGRHNEAAWAGRLERPLQYLFGKNDKNKEESTEEMLKKTRRIANSDTIGRSSSSTR